MNRFSSGFCGIRIQKQFGSLNDWLKSKDKDDPARKAYEHALRDVNEYLKQNVRVFYVF
jgi:hypothetical protein